MLRIFFLFCLSTTCLLAAPGDEFFVKSKIVNMRDGPSTDYPVLIKLKRGRKLVELQQQGNWMELSTGREDIPSGWIYNSLLTKVDPLNPNADSKSDGVKVETLFDLFKLALSELNERLKARTGVFAFAGAEDLGRGEIRLRATSEWVALSRIQRESHLSDAFQIWAAAVGDGVSITIHVVDDKGERFMTMLR